MKKLLLVTLTLLCFITACGPQLTIETDPTETKILVDETRELITFFVKMDNTSTLPSKDLFAKFHILEQDVAEALGFEIMVFSDHRNIPQAFQIKSNSSYFIAESYNYTHTIPLEQLIGSVEVVVFNEAGDTMSEFIIEQVEAES